MATNKRGTV